MPTAYIGIGSNIEPEKNIQKALILLSEKVLISGISTFYLTKPFDRTDQQLFYNGAARIETEDEPLALKYCILRNIEKKLGRKRTGDTSSPRTIDLDILVYDRIVIHDEKLHIPDPDILERPFLALPLYELSRNMILPGWNRAISAIAEQLKDSDMTPLTEYTEKLRRILKHEYKESRESGQRTAD
jgi:2-amino-4-hydroxy-6-hydroxymethyldihydropteridine diphosphokinase